LELATESPKEQMSDETPEQKLARALVKADLSNITTKLKAGKPLTRAERDFLHAQVAGSDPASVTFAKNQVELAELLGVERHTIQRWMKIPGNPGSRPDGRLDVGLWRIWAEGAGRKVAGETDVNTLKARLLLRQIERVEHMTAVSKRLHVPTADVEMTGARLGAGIRKVITTLHLKAPTLAHRDVEFIEDELRRFEDEIIALLYSLGEELDHMKQSTLEQVSNLDLGEVGEPDLN
jgi:predicted site-specific integrase-resolvase